MVAYDQEPTNKLKEVTVDSKSKTGRVENLLKNIKLAKTLEKILLALIACVVCFYLFL